MASVVRCFCDLRRAAGHAVGSTPQDGARPPQHHVLKKGFAFFCGSLWSIGGFDALKALRNALPVQFPETRRDRRIANPSSLRLWK